MTENHQAVPHTWGSGGCDTCRQGILSGSSTIPAYRLTSVEAHAHLRHCQRCGAWWQENEREAHVIMLAEAQRTFPAAFAR